MNDLNEKQVKTVMKAFKLHARVEQLRKMGELAERELNVFTSSLDDAASGAFARTLSIKETSTFV